MPLHLILAFGLPLVFFPLAILYSAKTREAKIYLEVWQPVWYPLEMSTHLPPGISLQRQPELQTLWNIYNLTEILAREYFDLTRMPLILGTASLMAAALFLNF